MEPTKGALPQPVNLDCLDGNIRTTLANLANEAAGRMRTHEVAILLTALDVLRNLAGNDQVLTSYEMPNVCLCRHGMDQHRGVDDKCVVCLCQKFSDTPGRLPILVDVNTITRIKNMFLMSIAGGKIDAIRTQT